MFIKPSIETYSPSSKNSLIFLYSFFLPGIPLGFFGASPSTFSSDEVFPASASCAAKLTGKKAKLMNIDEKMNMFKNLDFSFISRVL